MNAEQKQSEFRDTPGDWARRWMMEIQAAKKAVERWHGQGDKIIRRFRDEREASQSVAEVRWNVFSSNIITKQATLYGQTPKVSVARRFADAMDDLGRIGAEMMERLLNTDVERDDDGYAAALHYALEDRLLPGLGVARVRYEVEMEAGEGKPPLTDEAGEELAPEVPPVEAKAYECVATDYVHWRDFLWSAGARTWHEVRWVAFKAQMTPEELEKRFGDNARGVPLSAKQAPSENTDGVTPWSRADVWEVWSKEQREVFWVAEGHNAILDRKEDPLQLDAFFPCPRPMLANVTTSGMVPCPDFKLAQDLYDEVDSLSTRIKELQDAVRVTGVYDKASPEVAQVVQGGRNRLYPVDSWAAFAEKGGIKGVVDYLPLDQIVAAISVLSERRMVAMDALYQVEGMADIMRGQATSSGATATEQGIKAQFGSVRLRRLQDEFARFASDLQKLKAEIIAKHFDPQTILTQSNAGATFDAQLAPKAVELLKSQMAAYRIEVKPESVSLTDFAALKNERMEVLAGISAFLTSAGGLASSVPGSLPYLLQMLQWAVAGLKGSSQIEGVLDQAITAAQSAPPAQQGPPPQQDPKVIAQQVKGQQEMQKVQAELQADLVRTQAETQANEQRERTQAVWNAREAAMKAQVTQANRASNSQKPGGTP